MLKNYFTTAINNLLKNKLYSAINIIGLAVGLAACIIISIYVQHELSYDRHWEKGDLIYRINRSGSPERTWPTTSVLLLPALKKYFPEDIEFGTRIMGSGGEIQIGDMRYPSSFAQVDEDFINIFKAEVLKGSLKSTLQSPDNIALSEESAFQYFGDKDPIGEVIIFTPNNGTEQQYQVTAVYRFISPKTVLNIPCFSLLAESRIPENIRKWYNPWLGTYVRLSETADIDKFVSRLPNFINKTIPTDFMGLQPGQKMSDTRSYSLQKMSDIYFNPFDSGQIRVGNRTVIAVYIIISVLVLIIGCINFVILTTAKATQRAREVAMRKVVGARFKQLFIQFIGESLLITFMAFLISIAITELTIPFFETLMFLELAVPYTSPASYIFALFLVIMVGLSGGLYPAFVLSRFSPTKALKSNQATDAVGSFKLRNVLVIFQFTASIALIIATIVAYFQLVYTSKHDPGFNPENLLVLEGIANRDVRGYRNTLQQELLKLPEITDAALSSIQPRRVNGGIITTGNFRSKTSGSKQNQEITLHSMYVDYNFFNTYEISLLSGRYFSRNMDKEEPVPEFPSPQNKNDEEIKNRRIVINLAAARQLGYASADEAVGEIIVQGEQENSWYAEYSIIGVVEDSQYRNLRLKPAPEMYRLIPDVTFFLTVRYKGDYQKVVKEVKRVWHEVVGDITFSDSNVKQNLAATFVQERNENKVLISFALLAIFIACIGLFGMAAFTVDRRVKEIGVRKVMGAKVKDIVRLLGWHFLKPVFIANIIAWPVAIFAMQTWLERFPYRFHPLFMIPICLVSGFIALVIAWFTVAGNTKRVAKRKPIKALRYE
ncbi:MAG: ABC transporter permease [Desulfobacteraceae bacterium]|jgi:putative ABC transport system permease protein